MGGTKKEHPFGDPVFPTKPHEFPFNPMPALLSTGLDLKGRILLGRAAMRRRIAPAREQGSLGLGSGLRTWNRRFFREMR